MLFRSEALLQNPNGWLLTSTDTTARILAIRRGERRLRAKSGEKDKGLVLSTPVLTTFTVSVVEGEERKPHLDRWDLGTL